jgi:hypothetical protein
MLKCFNSKKFKKMVRIINYKRETEDERILCLELQGGIEMVKSEKRQGKFYVNS